MTSAEQTSDTRYEVRTLEHLVATIDLEPDGFWHVSLAVDGGGLERQAAGLYDPGVAALGAGLGIGTWVHRVFAS